MFKSNDKKKVISICCLLVILLIVGIVFLVNKTNTKNNTETVKNKKEQFADVEPLTSDELLKNLKSNPDGLQEVITLDNLTETITKIFNSKISEKISALESKLESELENQDVLDKLPVGTIIMWNDDNLPNGDKWKWCDGNKYNDIQTPNLKYRFPLGGKKYGEDADKPDADDNDGLIKEVNVPKHRHPLNGSGNNGTFPVLKHNHVGTTSREGQHNHTGTMSREGQHIHNAPVTSHNYDSGKLSTAKGLTFGQYIHSNSYTSEYSNWSSDKFIKEGGSHSHTLTINPGGPHTHTITINDSLEGADSQIANHIVGEGPIYNEGEDQKPFYPVYTLINFIIKVK